ncbi:MAG: polyprenyl synthetase family protein [Dehalococcoidia bacterium]|nr:Farnesyl diphosphate synthase [Chloroflexota bacterium]
MKLEKVLQEYRERIADYLLSGDGRRSFHPEHIRDAALHYLSFGGKTLRPATVFLACKAVGGNEEIALPAAAAVEVYHTWTLIHDDIIDRDEKRRGHLTVHEEFYRRALNEMRYSEEEARHYGLSLGILAGDMLQGWAVSLLCDLCRTSELDPELVVFLTNNLMGHVQNTLVEGEMLDIQYSKLPIDKLDIEHIIDMLEKKTGALYQFAGLAGAMIGLNVNDPEHPAVRTLSEFADKCGTAFQLRDDILGLIGSEEILGKSVGSDLREGKMTVILYHALVNANEKQRAILMSTAGNASATAVEIAQTTDLIIELGGIACAQKLAESYITDAALCLDGMPNLRHKELLLEWARFLISRNY